ncbi:16S rRNA (cytosine(967)-C(5))-methyltransferase RsmB [Thermodesulfobacteriota bacterium]
MKDRKPRDLALAALNELAYKTDFSQNYLDDLFKVNLHLDVRDKAFINHMVQGALRWRLRLDWILDLFSDTPTGKMDPPVLNILRLALYQIFFLDRVPDSAAVNEAVKQAKASGKTRFIAPFINGVLRNICRHKDHIPFPDLNCNITQYLSVYYSFPEWLVARWVREFGASFAEDLLIALNRIPSIHLRVNRLKVTREEVLESLATEGITGSLTEYSPDGIIIKDLKGNISELSCFKDGMFQVQDQAAQITSYLLAPQAGEVVLDVCAGNGGKSSHMAEIMEGQGTILALDNSRKRLINLVHNSRRLGIEGLHPVVGDASKPLSSLFHFKFDRILVDAPCSGLGVISRHPDGKWNRNEGTIKRLASFQKTIISQASSVLKHGGMMLYVTCTISREENEAVVDEFLNRNQDFHLENLKNHIPDWGTDLIDEQGFLKTFPNLHGMDGFFAALFIKR